MRATAALVALSVATFVYVTTELLPVGLLLPMAADLHATASSVGLLVTWYGLVVVLSSIALTRLTRRVPRRYLLAGLLSGSAVATGLAAAAPDYPVLVAARVATALTQALFWSIVVPTAAALYPVRRRGRAVGVVFAGGSLATVLGVPAGTWLGQQAGWRVAFVALAGLALLAAGSVAALLPTARRPPPGGSAGRAGRPAGRGPARARAARRPAGGRGGPGRGVRSGVRGADHGTEQPGPGGRAGQHRPGRGRRLDRRQRRHHRGRAGRRRPAARVGGPVHRHRRGGAQRRGARGGARRAAARRADW
jgi:MFS family permease